MIQLGNSTDGLWRIGREGAVLHTCKPGEGLAEATEAAKRYKSPGEQMRRQFWHTSAAKGPEDIGRTVDVGAPAPKAAPTIGDEAIAELLSGKVTAIDEAITSGDWDEALIRIAHAEDAGKDRVGVARAIESRLDDLGQ